MSTDSDAVTWVFRAATILIVALSSLLLLPSVKRPITASAGESLALDHPDRACAGCHKEIYDRYERKAMAHGSGLAENGLVSGGFTHAASGITYKLFLRDGKAWLSYDRASATAPLHGEQQLLYYIGSGLRGRTYLFEQNGFWFEAPVNFYSKAQVWDMAPAYGRATTMPFTLQVDSNCLRCHASEVQNSLKSARNRYDGAPFHAGGVGCVACHGDPTAHLAQGGAGPIINPSKLTAARRDSVCLQCHLEGDAAIYRAGKSSVPFRPGDDLSDDAVYFVNTSRAGFGNRATSQYEALLRSACKRGSGDRLTCTTCHDPHSSPSAEERVSFYRSKCLSCHTGATFAKMHHPEQQECAVCHMPTRKSDDISHEQLTDHDIEKQPPSALLASLDRPATNLVAVGNVVAGDRELGLAYASIAKFGDRAAGEKALRLLLKAEKAGADDADVHVQLGFLQQISGDRDAARAEYEAALAKDAYEPTAGANLAVLDATSGRLSEAVRLLQRVVEDDPGQTAAGLNLAFIECKMGQAAKAKETLALLRKFNPDSAPLRQFAETGVYSGQRCDLK